jgi:hypothetical protein
MPTSRSEPESAVELWVGATAAAGLIAAAMSPGLVVPAVVFTIAGAPASLWVLRTRAHRRYAAALPLALEQIAAHLRGGGTVGHGVAALAGGDGPLAGDLRRVQARADLGVGLADALAAWPIERGVGDVRAVAGALAVAETLGGRSAHAIDGLAASLRDRIGAAAGALAVPGTTLGGRSRRRRLRISCSRRWSIRARSACWSHRHRPPVPRGRPAARGGRRALDAAHPRVGGGTVSAFRTTVLLWLVGGMGCTGGGAALAVRRAARRRALRPLQPACGAPAHATPGCSDGCSRRCRRASSGGCSPAREHGTAPAAMPPLSAPSCPSLSTCSEWPSVPAARRTWPSTWRRGGRRRVATTGTCKARARSAPRSPALDDLATVPTAAAPRGRASLPPTGSSPVGPALARLAAEQRAELRRHAEANARRVPVRFLFPLVFVVLPAFGLLTVIPTLLAGFSRI